MEDFNKLKVPEVKNRLRALKLPLKGKKADLLARLQAAVTSGTPVVASSDAPPTAPPALGYVSEKPSPMFPSANQAEGSGSNQTVKETSSMVVAKQSSPKKPRLDPRATVQSSPRVLHIPRQNQIAVHSPQTTFKPLQSTSALSVDPSAPATYPHASNRAQVLPDVGPDQLLASTKRTRIDFKPLLPSKKHAALAVANPARSNVTTSSRFSPPTSLLDKAVHYTATEAISRLFEAWPQRLYASLTPASSFSFISPALYTQGEPFQMAFRFCISRLVFLLGRGGSDTPEEAKELLANLPIVVAADRLVEGVWHLQLNDGSHVQVLEATGEVVGSDEVAQNLQLGQPNRAKVVRLRADWAHYINELKAGRAKRLHELVKGGDEEEFRGGLSNRIDGQAAQDEQMAKSVVKYLMAQSTPNGISGSHSSPLVEAHLAASLPVDRSCSSGSSPSLGFYLPSSLCLESLHLPSATSKLHPDLIIAQTAGEGALFCLRETGQVVGTEAEGVAPLWMSLLRCSAKGQQT